MSDQVSLTHSPTNDLPDGPKTVEELTDISNGDAIYSKIEKLSPSTTPRSTGSFIPDVRDANQPK